MPYSNRSSFVVLGLCAAAAAVAIWSVQFAPPEKPRVPDTQEARDACENYVRSLG